VIEVVPRLVGRGVGLGAGALAAALRFPEHLIASGTRRPDPDIGRLGPVRFDEARHLPLHRGPTDDGGSLFTVSHGHGPAFLFVHGLGMTSRIWTKQFRMLPPAGIRTVAFDHRGHGASTAAPSGPGPEGSRPSGSIDQLADDVRAVVQGLELRDLVIVGHSMGGMALLAFAIRHPDVLATRVRGIVLVSTAARLDLHRVPLVPASMAAFAAGFVQSGAWSRSDWSTLAARTMFGRDAVPSQVELVRVLLATASEETVVACADAIARFDVERHLREITVPTMVVAGTADLFTTPRDARRLARGLVNARLELLPGAGHMLMLERAERLGALLSGFARDLGVAAGLAA
jgi:pimeloyl-ACP methyl ester carboxylesterase